jgi:hypothetical protein
MVSLAFFYGRPQVESSGDVLKQVSTGKSVTRHWMKMSKVGTHNQTLILRLLSFSPLVLPCLYPSHELIDRAFSSRCSFLAISFIFMSLIFLNFIYLSF